MARKRHFLLIYPQKCGIFTHFTNILGIFPYVAVVCDTDGSAFITKAEFDSLKNNFQAQIDNYNQSIDSKIDGAIASYLAGIKVNTDDTPKYRAYGTSIGSFNGEPVNAFYLTPVHDGAIASGNSYLFHMTSGTATQRPGNFGFGWWVTLYHGSTVPNLGKPVPNGCLGYVRAKMATSTKPKIYYKINAGREYPHPSPSTSYTLKEFDINDWNSRVCSAELSDSFQSMITLVRPKFPILEFRDEGDITFKVVRCVDAVHYEAMVHQDEGYDCIDSGSISSAEAHCPLGTDSDVFDVELEHAGTSTTLKKIKDCSNLTLVTLTAHVYAGDRILLSLNRDSTANWWTGTISSLMFSNTIPGWELETT